MMRFQIDPSVISVDDVFAMAALPPFPTKYFLMFSL